jgi:tetratricopeptide (TPR) repeat protein
MIYALAITAGYSTQDAKVIADGSWSIDQNNATLALRGGLGMVFDAADVIRFTHRINKDAAFREKVLDKNHPEELNRILLSPDGDLGRIGPAALMHSLLADPKAHGDDPNTPTLDVLNRDYIRDQAARLRASGLGDADVNKAQLLLTGQYLHQLVDSFVHPHEPLLGHAFEGHGADYAIHHQEEFTQAAFKALTALNVMRPELTGQTDNRLKALRLETTEKQLNFCEGLVNAVAEGYDLARKERRDHQVAATAAVAGFERKLPDLKQLRKPRDFQEITPKERVHAGETVQRYMNMFFETHDSNETLTVPRFDKATYSQKGNKFVISYQGSPDVAVDHLVSWTVQQAKEKPGYEALLESVRQTIRNDVRRLNLPRLGSLKVIKDAKVGGVMLRFDTAGYEGEASEEDLARVLDQLQRFLATTERGAIVLQLRERRETFHVVPLRRLLESGDRTLGGLTRVRGYVRDSSGDVYLVGLAESGQHGIDLDLLTVALRTIWKEGHWPFVSLDPDPNNFGGPQRARVGGVPDGLRDTAFVRTMLDADYKMKEISIGKTRPAIEGFKSYPDLLREQPEARGEEAAFRLWLAPLPSPGGDVFATRRDAAEAVVFESQVQVLTETMKRAGEYLAGTGETDPVAEEAAAMLTRHYDSLARAYPDFRQLQAIFDVAKLCAIWRARGVGGELLEQLAERRPERVEVPSQYEGIRRQVEGTSFLLTGGANTRSYISTKGVVATDKLTPLLDALKGEWTGPRRQAGEIVLPPAVEIDPALLAGFNAELILNRGVEYFTHARYEAALDRLDLALELDPEMPVAYAYRGVTLLSLGALKEAMADMDRAVTFEPRMQAFRGVLRAYSGDSGGALKDADESGRAFADEESVVAWNALARIYAFDLPAAEESANRLLAIAPLSPEGYNVRTLIDFLHKLGPTRAKDRVDKLRRLPIPIIEAYTEGVLNMQRLNFPDAVAQLRVCLGLIMQRDADEDMRAFHMRERCQLALVLALRAQANMLERFDKKASDRAAAEAFIYCDDLVEQHPDWPTGYLMKGMGGDPRREEKPGGAKALFDRAYENRNAGDPLLDDLSVFLGSDRALAVFGLGILFNQRNVGPEGPEILDRVIELAGEGPATELLKALRRVSRARSSRDALGDMRKAYEAVPESLPTDPVTLLCLGHFTAALIMAEKDAGDKEHLRDAALKYLRVTAKLEGLDFMSLTQTATFRFLMVTTLMMEYYEPLLRDHPRIRGVRTKLANGDIRPEEVRRVLQVVREELVAEARKGESRFVAGYVASTMQDQEAKLETELKAVAENYVRNEAADEAERRRLRAVLDEWKNYLDKLKSDKKSQIERQRATWELQISGAETTIELRTVAMLLEMLQMAAGIAAGADPDASAQLREVVGPLLAKIKAKKPGVGRIRHDWDGWPGTTSGNKAEAPPAFGAVEDGGPKTGGVGGRTGLWLGALASAVVLAVVGAVIFQRARARRRLDGGASPGSRYTP